MSLQNPLDGMVASILDILIYLGDVAHTFLHLLSKPTSKACWRAEVLSGSGSSIRNLGSMHALLACPPAAFLASWSAFSFPSTPLCPFIHPILSLKAGCLAHCQVSSICAMISSIMICAGFGLQIDSTPSTAWLSRRMVALCIPHSLLSKCSAIRTPTASASNTVCSVSVPRLYLRILSLCPRLHITAAAPTLPSCPELSEKIWTSSSAISAILPSPTSSDIMTLALISYAGADRTGLIVSTMLGIMPSIATNLCIGDLCVLIYHLALTLNVLWSG